MGSVTTQGVTVSLDELIKLRYPARSIALHSNRRVTTHLAGGYRSVLRGRGMDFNEVRIYQPGDDIRNMDWCVTARTGKPHTKLYHEEKERPVYFVVDMGPQMYFGTRGAFKSVVAARAAALLGWSVVNNGDRIGAIVFSGQEQWQLRPRSRKYGILPFLKQLADRSGVFAENYDKHALAKALWHLRHVTHPGSMIFIISDFITMEEEAERHLSRLAKQNVIVGLDIYDRLEMRLPDPNIYQVTDGKQTVAIDTAQQSAMNAYHQEFMHEKMLLGRTFKRYHLPLIKLATNDNVVTILTRYFGHNVARTTV